MERGRRALELLLAATLIAAPLWGGTARPPATLVLAGAGVVALLLALVAARRVPAAPVAWPLAIMMMLCLLQLVPLPARARVLLDPEGERARDAMLRGLDGLSRWRPLTMDAAATLHEAARLGGLAALAIAAASLARHSRGRRVIAGAAGAALALVALVPCVAALGIAIPTAIAPPAHRLVVLPFANANHAASLCALVLPLVLAAAARATGRAAAAWIALAIAGNLLLVATLSRAGIAVGFAGQVATLAWIAASQSGSRARRLGALLGTAGLLAVALFGARLWPRLTALSADAHAGHIDRMLVARDAWRLVLAHPWTGVGRGAFALVFASYSAVAGQLRFAFAENEYLQLAADFGIVGAALVLLAALAAATRLRLRAGATLQGAALVGMAAVALHNVVDFSWEAGGVAAPFVAVAALAFTRVRARADERRPRRAATAGALALVIGSSLTLALAASPLGRRADAEARRVSDALAQGRPADEVAALAARALVRHPADGYLADVAAQALVAARSPAALTWIARALAARPGDPLAHAIFARALAQAGDRDGAAAELADAFAAHPAHYVDALAAHAVATFAGDDDDDALAAAASTPAAARAIGAELARLRRWRALVAVAGRGLALDGADVTLQQYRVRAALELDMPSLAEPALTSLAARPDPSPWSAELAARALLRLGRAGDAAALLARALERDDDTGCALLLARTLAPVDRARAREVLDAALARAGDGHERAAIDRALAELDERDGRRHRAAAERAEAARLESP